MKIRKYRSELVCYGILFVIAFLALAELDTFERFYQFSRDHEGWELDEIALLIPVALLCLVIFTIRRLVELRKATAQLRRSQQEIEVAYSQLHKASESKERFMAVACHELQSPLSGVIGALRFVKHSKGKEETYELVDLALNSTMNLKTLIDDVLEFSRLSIEDHSFESVDFDLNEVTESIREIIQRQVEDKGLGFHMAIDENVPQTICGNAACLRLVVLNLVGNAIKYTDKGSVSVRFSHSREPDEALTVAIADTGAGIPQDKLEIIFEPYRQATDWSASKQPGIGLGLSIVKRFVEQLGGSISVESTPGKGSEFSVRLPVGLR